MKMTNEQFEALINLINCSIGVCNDVAYEPIYKIDFEKARALLVDDISQDEPPVIHALGAEVNGKYFPMYNPKTHFPVPFTCSHEDSVKIREEYIGLYDLNYSIGEACLGAITKVFSNKK